MLTTRSSRKMTLGLVLFTACLTAFAGTTALAAPQALLGPVAECFAAAESTVDPVPRSDKPWWAERHKWTNARVQAGDVGLIFIGDSITQAWEGPGEDVWDYYYGDRKAVNLGFSGDRTQHVLWRLENGNVAGISPEAAVLLIGTNNYKDNSAGEIAAGITAIVEKLREKLPETEVLILGIFPRGYEPNPYREKFEEINATVAKLADNEKVHYLYFGDAFLEPDGTLPKSMMPDSLHLTSEAYVIWAEEMEPKLAELLGETPKEPMWPPPGFEPLFNGKDLTGWKGLVANPKARAKMSDERLAKAQADADESMREHWHAKDGVLIFDGEGASLCTDKDYGDFEMLVDWQIAPNGDSGIYLRGSPQVQIWDPADHPEGSGGLYNNKEHPSKPLKCADNPVGEWNRFRIKMVGERVTLHLNGELVVDNVVMENYWERDKPIYPAGQIELQSHHTPLWFRNIYIKEL